MDIALNLTQSFTLSGWQRMGVHHRWLTIVSVESVGKQVFLLYNKHRNLF